MREIKFRAWDTIQKKMHIGSDKPYMYLTNSERLIGIGCNLHHSMYHDTSRSFDKEIILMQFTGLKDINDKEVYEGDIIQTRGGSKTSYKDDENILVEFDGGGFVPFATQIDEYYTVNIEYTPVEVIGNIYKNPELLKK